MDIPSDFVKALLPAIDGVGVVAVAIGTAKTFEWFDGMLSDRGRVALKNWLTNSADVDPTNSWGAVFPKLIDKVFGERALSWKFFARSCLASVIAVLLIMLIPFRLLHAPVGVRDLGFFGGIATIANCLPDYISLLASRMIVRFMARNSNNMRVLLLLLADTALTTLIAAFSVLLAHYAWGWYWVSPNIIMTIHPFPSSAAQLVYDYSRQNFLALQWLRPTVNRFGVFFYSAFFTSIWVWLYVLSGWVIKAMVKVRRFWKSLGPNLNLDKPLVTMGRVAGVLLAAAYAMLLGAVWLFRHVHS